ncbi:hypothetical protein BST81_05840 [Leptolyngbya sp. 'hensonii']|uniref:hypothetical protein n=1 Tax=Leptolyngbya sp. 'hensonii' TaxID=1922337 RepID=UPI00094FE623|nr:hypothetical protein [Leptolyngbya sp. 'hensonii']OLP19278.1 hypothetical protein BST81_05840 [Leptolyngbya sp. 'hensonii']
MELVQRAQKGDPDAIANLLNQALAHKQVTTQVNLLEGRLEIQLQGALMPPPNVANTLIDRALGKLHSPCIQQVQVQALDEETGQITWEETFEPGSRLNLPSRSASAPVRSTPRERTQPRDNGLAPRSLDREGWGALIIGLVLALLVFISPLKFLLSGFLILTHEMGHALTHWLFGRPSIPSVDLAFGGGVTLTFDQVGWLVGLIYLAIGGLFFLFRLYPPMLVLLTILTGFYTYCLRTNWNWILSTFMGHGMELIAILLCLYLGISGRFSRLGGDRTIYSLLGWFTLLFDLQFSWKLLQDVDFQEWYEAGKGGVIDNDFVILANDYFNRPLSTLITQFLIACLVMPVLAFLIFRYERRLLHLLGKLVAD